MLRQKFFRLLPYLICFIFFIAYSTLSIVRHNHYQSFGFDLGINDQVVWEYSHFKPPVTTIDQPVFSSKLFIHVELIYALLAPFYWLWSDPRMLLLLQAFAIVSSGIPIFLLAKKYKLKPSISYALLVSYLTFYGIQNALWFDAHSAPFGAAFLTWFIYFLDAENIVWSAVTFLLTIISKENLPAMTMLVSLVYLIKTRKLLSLSYVTLSIVYLGIIFGIYFPYFVPSGYRFAHEGGLFSNLNLANLFNTEERRQVWFYTFLWVGFIPLLYPLMLLPVVGNLASFFLLGSDVDTAQGLFLQYRVGLAPLIIWATILTITKYKYLNKNFTIFYLIFFVCFIQYSLHLPLSYLTKSWFWDTPKSVNNLNFIINNYVPNDAAIVAQNNIIPHLSERNNIFTLYPETKSSRDWFRWASKPQYLLVDTSIDWDIRHLLANRDNFIKGLKNMEKAGVIVVDKIIGDTILYKVNKSP
jgi:uncharacterized membrane protein